MHPHEQADSGNHIIRLINVTSHNVSTLAGSPGVATFANGLLSLAAFSSPKGVAFDGFGNVLVVDGGNELS